MVSWPWKIEAGGETNVTLKGSKQAMEALQNWGRCYVNHFSFKVRQFDVRTWLLTILSKTAGWQMMCIEDVVVLNIMRDSALTR